MDETAVLTPGAHRPIRMLDRQDSAYSGELITDGERRGVRVDAETVPDVVWAFAGAEHVAGVRDVLRRADGHDAVLPWCADPVDVFLGRRAAGETAMTAGETVTLVGSLLRGVAEVAERSVPGRWWLTDEARPMFAPGEGAACAEETVAIIAQLRENSTDRAMDRLLGEIAGVAADWRVVLRSAERWEKELSELAAPRPLERAESAQARVMTAESHRSLLPVDIDETTDQPSAVRLAGARIARVLRSAGRRALQRMPHRHRASVPVGGQKAVPDAKAGRGRLLLAGGTAAAVVLVGGLMWPPSDGDSAATEHPVAQSSGAGRPSPAPTDTSKGAPATIETDAPGLRSDASPQPGRAADPDAVEDGSAEQRAVAALAAVDACAQAEDAVCADAIAEGAGALVQERLAGTSARRDVTAVEDYGDVSVLRLGPSGDRGEQMLVLVSQKDRWLVRDVYDVADQPSDQG